MKEHKKFLFGILLVTSLACRILTPEAKTTETRDVSTEARTYENENFIFTIPAGWRIQEEVWNRPMTPGAEYYDLGVQIIITIQYPPYQGQGSMFFTVAFSPLADGENLESRFTQAYENTKTELKNTSQQLFERGTLVGLETTFQRPWGEPWWQFRDIWVEKDASIYVFSFQTYINEFENCVAFFDQILDSFQFKE